MTIRFIDSFTGCHKKLSSEELKELRDGLPKEVRDMLDDAIPRKCPLDEGQLLFHTPEPEPCYLNNHDTPETVYLC